MRSPRARTRAAVGAATACVVACLTAWGAAPASGAVYPDGGSTFSGGADGWTTTAATCDLPLLCSASGGYEAGQGSPPGSLSADTDMTFNLVSVFHSSVTFVSPDFVVASGGAATLHLDRQFAEGGLINVGPTSRVLATLFDRTAGSQSTVLDESVPPGSAFIGSDGAATTVSGHRYALQIEVRTSTSVLSLSPFSAVASTRLDNIGLAVGGGGGGGGGGEGGGGSGGGAGGAGSGGGGAGGAGGSGAAAAGLSRQQLARVLRRTSLRGAAIARGNRVVARVRCPAQLGTACRILMQGMLTRRKPATNRGKGQVASGKQRRFQLRVKPRVRRKAARRRSLLFKEVVKAGGKRATVFKRLRIVHRGH